MTMAATLGYRREISVLMILSLLFTFTIGVPVQSNAGFLSGLKNVLSTSVGILGGITGAVIGAAVGGPLGAVIGGVGGFLVTKGLSGWTLNHAGTIAGAVAGGVVGSGAGPLGTIVGAIIGGVLGNKVDDALNATSKTANAPNAPNAAQATMQEAQNRYKVASTQYQAAVKKGDAVAAKRALIDQNKAAYDYYYAQGNQDLARQAKAAYEKCVADYTAMTGNSSSERSGERYSPFEAVPVQISR